MRKPRLLILLTHVFSVRYVVRTGLLDEIKAFSQPVLLLSWEDRALQEELEGFGAEVRLLPKAEYGADYRRVRRQIDTWHAFRRLKSPSTEIDERRFNLEVSARVRILKKARRLRHLVKFALPGGEARMFETERSLLYRDTNISKFREALVQLRPDAAFSVTPFHQQEELLLRAAAEARVPLCTSIISFDNITTRGWIPMLFDQYMVWNRYNLAEFRRAYPEAAGRPVHIVGPAQFDFYWDKAYHWPEAQWRHAANLPPERPVILYAGGVYMHVPHEPVFLRQLDEAISCGELPDNPVILFRRHPLDPHERWLPVLRSARHVISDEPWAIGAELKYSNVDSLAIAKLVSTLKHTNVHVNVCSTMTLDGAVFDKPQIGPAYDDQPGKRYARILRELYQKEHFRPIVSSGGIQVVRSRDEMIGAVRDALRYPEKHRMQRKKMLEDVCTYLDGGCTKRVADVLHAFMSKSVHSSATMTANA